MSVLADPPEDGTTVDVTGGDFNVPAAKKLFRVVRNGGIAAGSIGVKTISGTTRVFHNLNPGDQRVGQFVAVISSTTTIDKTLVEIDY